MIRDEIGRKSRNWILDVRSPGIVYSTGTDLVLEGGVGVGW